jgi:hypothetical protein
MGSQSGSHWHQTRADSLRRPRTVLAGEGSPIDARRPRSTGLRWLVGRPPSRLKPSRCAVLITCSSVACGARKSGSVTRHASIHDLAEQHQDPHLREALHRQIRTTPSCLVQDQLEDCSPARPASQFSRHRHGMQAVHADAPPEDDRRPVISTDARRPTSSARRTDGPMGPIRSCGSALPRREPEGANRGATGDRPPLTPWDSPGPFPLVGAPRSIRLDLDRLICGGCNAVGSPHAPGNKLWGPENCVTSRDLRVFVDEAAKSITAQNPDVARWAGLLRRPVASGHDHGAAGGCCNDRRTRPAHAADEVARR